MPMLRLSFTAFEKLPYLVCVDSSYRHGERLQTGVIKEVIRCVSVPSVGHWLIYRPSFRTPARLPRVDPEGGAKYQGYGLPAVVSS